MLVWATRTVSALTLRALFYGGLFLFVVMMHVAITSALRSSGWSPSLSLIVSGAGVLVVVLACVQFADYLREKRAAAREIQRMHEGLPSGPCCVVWRSAGDGGDADMPWAPKEPIRVPYPKLARRLGVEGICIVDFEINAEGAPKNIHVVDAWPSDVFYASARKALEEARFVKRADAQVRFGVSYRMPFVFRISGAAKLKDRGHRAKPHRPAMRAAQQAVEKLRRSA